METCPFVNPKGSQEEPWYTPTIREFLISDVPHALGISPKHLARDVITLERRLAAEGESFLTKTLPAFAKSYDLALQGHTPLATPLFKKVRGSALPKFLSALHRRVFKDDGWMRDQPCITSIRLTRQLLLWCKKVKKGYSDESLQRAIADFIEVDEALPDALPDLSGNARLLVVARTLVTRIFRDIGSIRDHCPNHGPGAVARSQGPRLQKRALAVCYRQLEKMFRPIPWMRSLRDVAENLDEVLARETYEYGLSNLAFVEKDSSGPRTIGLEPEEYQWCQQAVKDWLVKHLEGNLNIARGHVNFTNQDVNRAFARSWSLVDTLDMSKASDRNSLALVSHLFADTRVLPWLLASRTPGTVLPDGTIFLYKKFAPMGSATCFPVQATVYYALACAALHLAGMPLFLACRSVYVYGDDLIVPHGFFAVLNSAFQSVGLKFNPEKCCVHGKFRESCGLDAYDGVDVTPVRMRVSIADGDTDLAKIVKHSNRLATSGYWNAAIAYEKAAKRTYQRLRALKLARSARTDLPVLAWPEIEGRDTVQRRQVRKNGLSTSTTVVRGWALKPLRLRLDAAFEARYLRESLCSGGPVGTLKSGRAEALMPESVFREVDAKYSGALSFGQYTVIRECSTSTFDKCDKSPDEIMSRRAVAQRLVERYQDRERKNARI